MLESVFITASNQYSIEKWSKWTRIQIILQLCLSKNVTNQHCRKWDTAEVYSLYQECWNVPYCRKTFLFLFDFSDKLNFNTHCKLRNEKWNWHCAVLYYPYFNFRIPGSPSWVMFSVEELRQPLTASSDVAWARRLFWLWLVGKSYQEQISQNSSTTRWFIKWTNCSAVLYHLIILKLLFTFIKISRGSFIDYDITLYNLEKFLTH